MEARSSFRDLLVLNYFPRKEMTYLGARTREPELCLQAVLKGLGERGLKPLAVEVIPDFASSGDYFLSLIIDLDGVGEGSLRELVSELESSGLLNSSRIIPPTVKGLVGDMYFDFKGFLGNRAIIVGAPALSGFLRGLYTTFKEAGAVFLYHSGKNIGSTAARIYRATLGITDLEVMYRAAELFFHSLGYVRSLTFERSGETITAVLDENIECLLLRDFKLPPTCNWLRGMIEGVVEVFENRVYESEEVKCVNSGDARCRIVLRPASK